MVKWLGQLLSVITSLTQVTVMTVPVQEEQVSVSKLAEPPWLVKVARSVAGAGTSAAHCTFVVCGQLRTIQLTLAWVINGAARKLNAVSAINILAPARRATHLALAGLVWPQLLAPSAGR